MGDEEQERICGTKQAMAGDDVYGVIGIEGLDQLKSYTFDYRTMRSSASAE